MTNYAAMLKRSRLEVEMLPSEVAEYAPKSEMVTTSLRTERPWGEDWARKRERERGQKGTRDFEVREAPERRRPTDRDWQPASPLQGRGSRALRAGEGRRDSLAEREREGERGMKNSVRLCHDKF